MTGFLYSEETGKKGADNVCSSLFKWLTDKGWLKNTCGGALYVIADNCTGQNKNQTVIRFLLWLVESGYFKKACLSFLVRGHTKNACDRSFNLMKKRFHKQDIYTYDQLLEVLGQHKQVTMVDVESNDFEAWGEYLDTFYKRMKPGIVAKNHAFQK